MSIKIKNFLTQYSTEKLLALIITFILWTFAISMNQEVRDYSVKLNLIIAKDQIVVSENVDFIQVKVSGSVFDFAKIEENNLVVNIDLSARKPGKYTRLLDANIMTFAKDVNVEKIFPSEIVIKTSKRIERKVNIDPWLDGQPAVGWKINGYKVTPKKVTISGPEKEIEEIDSVTTEKIILNTLKGAYEKEHKIVLPSIHISTVDTNIANVSIQLERDIKTRTYQNIPVMLDSNEPAEITPKTVTVTLKAPKDILEKMSSEGFSVFVKDNPEKKSFKAKEYYFKNLDTEVELQDLKKEIEIKVKKGEK